MNRCYYINRHYFGYREKWGDHRHGARVPHNTRHYIVTAANNPRHPLPQTLSARLACTQKVLPRSQTQEVAPCSQAKGRFLRARQRLRLVHTQQEVAPCSHAKFCSTALYPLPQKRSACAPKHPNIVSARGTRTGSPALQIGNTAVRCGTTSGRKSEAPCSHVSVRVLGAKNK